VGFLEISGDFVDRNLVVFFTSLEDEEKEAVFSAACESDGTSLATD
jgi:hypothetical protein